MVQISQIDVVPYVHCVSKDGMELIKNMVIDSIVQTLHPNKYSFTNSRSTKMFKGISRQYVAYGIHIHPLAQSKYFPIYRTEASCVDVNKDDGSIYSYLCTLDSFYIQNPNVIVY